MGAIILGYDDSSGAKAALEQAVVLAKQFGDRLIIGFGAEPPGASLEGTEYKEHLSAIEQLGRQATEAALARARSEGVDAEVELVPERPSQTLVDLAEKYDARYIVVGSHGESPLKGAILGSTPHKLVHLSEVPVLVVRA